MMYGPSKVKSMRLERQKKIFPVLPEISVNRSFYVICIHIEMQRIQ